MRVKIRENLDLTNDEHGVGELFTAERSYLVVARVSRVRKRRLRKPIVKDVFLVLTDDCEFDQYLEQMGSFPRFIPVEYFEVTDNDCSSWKKVIYQNHLGYDEVVFLAESKYFELQEMPSFYENLAGGVPEYTRAFCEAFPPKTWFQKDDGAFK